MAVKHCYKTNATIATKKPFFQQGRDRIQAFIDKSKSNGMVQLPFTPMSDSLIASAMNGTFNNELTTNNKIDNTVYVSPNSGNNETGILGNQDKQFSTIKGAIDAINKSDNNETWRIKLQPGRHEGVTFSDRNVTLEGSLGTYIRGQIVANNSSLTLRDVNVITANESCLVLNNSNIHVLISSFIAFGHGNVVDADNNSNITSFSSIYLAVNGTLDNNNNSNTTNNGSNSSSDDNSSSDKGIECPGRKSILELLTSDNRFSTLRMALETSGLLLDDSYDLSNVTIFAPTNEAFNRLDPGILKNLLNNPGELRKLLKLHIVESNLVGSKLSQKSHVNALDGSKLPIRYDDGRLFVNNVEVVDRDVHASNGTIHMIDGILVPHSETSNASLMSILIIMRNGSRMISIGNIYGVIMPGGGHRIYMFSNEGSGSSFQDVGSAMAVRKVNVTLGELLGNLSGPLGLDRTAASSSLENVLRNARETLIQLFEEKGLLTDYLKNVVKNNPQSPNGDKNSDKNDVKDSENDPDMQLKNGTANNITPKSIMNCDVEGFDDSHNGIVLGFDIPLTPVNGSLDNNPKASAITMFRARDTENAPSFISGAHLFVKGNGGDQVLLASVNNSSVSGGGIHTIIEGASLAALYRLLNGGQAHLNGITQNSGSFAKILTDDSERNSTNYSFNSTSGGGSVINSGGIQLSARTVSASQNNDRSPTTANVRFDDYTILGNTNKGSLIMVVPTFDQHINGKILHFHREGGSYMQVVTFDTGVESYHYVNRNLQIQYVDGRWVELFSQ